MSSPSLDRSFPSWDDTALAFFKEARRHYEDALILAQANRYPAAVASATKCVELAVKSTIIMAGGLGWWPKIFETHAPLKDIKAHSVLSQAIRKPIDDAKPGLIAQIESLEDLSPNKAGAHGFVLTREANAEYPFLALNSADVSGCSVELYVPTDFFDKTRSIEAVRTAYDTLQVLSQLSSKLGGLILDLAEIA